MKVVSFVAILCLLTVGCLAKQEKNDHRPSQFDNTVQSPERSQIEEALVRKLNGKCSQKDVSSCVMLKLVTYMNRMLKKAAIQLGDDLEITQNSAAIEAMADSPKSFDSSPRTTEASEEDQLTQLLLDKAWTFVKTRSLRWKVLDDAELVIANTPEADGSMNIGMSIKTSKSGEGRGKNKNLGPFLAAAAMKIGLLGGLAFKGLVLLVGKALLVSKIALLLASIIGLKKLFSQQKHVTYEVVAHPHHHESGGHEINSDWGRESGRSDQSAHELAYSAQKPKDDGFVPKKNLGSNNDKSDFKPIV